MNTILLLLDPSGKKEDTAQIGNACDLDEKAVARRVVYLGAKEAGRTEVGIAFNGPTPRLWGIAAPPEASDTKKTGAK